MQIYLVNYWLPFPSSEYGGLECVIARDADHCVELIVERVSKHERSRFPDYERLIQNAVAHSKMFYLNGDYKPGVVESFIT